MSDSTRVTLSLDELVILKAAMAAEIQNIDWQAEHIGDPDGFEAKHKAMVEVLNKKFGAALKRVLDRSMKRDCI